MSTWMVCAVRDSAVDAYGVPVFVRAKGEALRGFMDEVRRVDSPMNKHPSDYTLFFIGQYDDATGTMQPVSPQQLLRAKDCLTDISE